MQTIFPILRYNDARGAIRWLCAAFGFIELFAVPESGQFVRHAQLKLGTNVIILGSVRPDERMASPQVLGAATRKVSACMLTTSTRISNGRDRQARELRVHPKIRTLAHASTTSWTWRGIPGRSARTSPMQIAGRSSGATRNTCFSRAVRQHAGKLRVERFRREPHPDVWFYAAIVFDVWLSHLRLCSQPIV